MRTVLSLLFLFAFGLTSAQNDLIELYNTANSQYQAGEYQAAIKNYTKLLDATPLPLVIKRAYINRGLSYDRSQQFDKAIADFTEAIKLDSTDMASFVDRGLSHMHAGSFEKAIRDYNYVIYKNTDARMTQNSMYWKARIYFTQGKMEEVTKIGDQYFLIRKDDWEMHFIVGNAYSFLRKFEESIAQYDKAIELKPNYWEAISNRGTAKINLLTGNGNLQPSKKETKSACKDLKKAMEMGGNSIEDLYYVYCKMKR